MKPASPSSESMQRPVNPSSDLKVIGEVGAGYLKSKSAISYSSLIGTDLSRLTEMPRVVEFQRSPQRMAESPAMIQSATADEISNHWIDFVSQVSKSHIAVGTSLTETSILDVHNGMVRIACPNDYHFSTLKRNRDFLTEALHRVVGKRVAIEPVLCSGSDIPVKPVFKTTLPEPGDIVNGNTDSRQPSLSSYDHPILALFKRELGAERLE